MGVIDFKNDARLKWLRFVLNPCLPRPDIWDWQTLFEFAERQALVGVCTPTRFEDLRLPKNILMQWIGAQTVISNRNSLLNRQTALLYEILKSDGLRCCILKGQGNVTFYPIDLMRTPGDIDVWVDTEEDALLEYVKKQFPEEKESFKHIKFPVFPDTPVDLHYTPLKIYHPKHNKRLQSWLALEKEIQMSHYVRLVGTGGNVAIPTAKFNAVYQLGHILVHIEDEGIGFRQIVDYFYVLKQVVGLSDKEKREIIETWRWLGLRKLAAAVMWVEHELLGLPEDCLLVAPNGRMGRLLAEDIMEGGNFGHHSDREKYRQYGSFAKKLSNAWHMIRLSSCFPGDAFFRLLTKMKNGVLIITKKLRNPK